MPHDHTHHNDHSHHKGGHNHHSHAHGEHHHHGDANNHGQAFVITILLNSIFIVVEFGYGFIANSTALMADAGHNLSDVLGLGLAWAAAIFSRRAPNQHYTYGLRSSSILAALANAMFLLFACGAIAWEAVMRFTQPHEVAGLTVSVVAFVGIMINGISAWLFISGSKNDLNIRGAYLHMLADAAISLGVAVSGIIIIFTNWNWLDPVISIAIVGVIVAGTWGLLRAAMRLALNAAPEHIDVAGVEHYLRECDGVSDIHDLHIWGISTTECALTVHLVIPNGYPGDAYMDMIMHELSERFNIHHSTLQVEQGTTNHRCMLNV